MSSPYSLPKLVSVHSIVQSRYEKSCGVRPSSWDKRIEGVDLIKSTEGEVIKLSSDGMQSTPQPGWSIILKSGNNQSGYEWTLYGI